MLRMLIRFTGLPCQLNSTSYKVVEIDGKRYYAHRIKAGLGKKKRGGRKSKLVVDHKDSDTKDNKRSNLRVTTRGKNVGKANRLRKRS